MTPTNEISNNSDSIAYKVLCNNLSRRESNDAYKHECS